MFLVLEGLFGFPAVGIIPSKWNGFEVKDGDGEGAAGGAAVLSLPMSSATHSWYHSASMSRWISSAKSLQLPSFPFCISRCTAARKSPAAAFAWLTGFGWITWYRPVRADKGSLLGLSARKSLVTSRCCKFLILLSGWWVQDRMMASRAHCSTDRHLESLRFLT